MSHDFEQLINDENPDAFHSAVDAYEEAEDQLPDLGLATFSEIELVGFDFTGMDLSNVEFSDSTLTGVCFDECVLDGAFLEGCTFLNCSFEDVSLRGTAIDESTFSRCGLEELDIERCEFTDSQFDYCEIRGLNGGEIFWKRITFNEGFVEQFVPKSGTLKFVTFRSMRLGDVDLTACDISSCYFMELERDNVDLSPEFSKKAGRRMMS